ncbi:MAG: VOC family protein [Sedimentitalea sp.]
MTIEMIDHIQLAMPAGQEALARAFYGDGLGLNEVAKPAHLAKRGGCWFELGAVRVHLGVDADFHPAQKAHPAFIVSNLAALRQKLAGAGYRVQDDTSLEGYMRTYVYDPFGNRIELMEPCH